jgi:transposase InsO family protein
MSMELINSNASVYAIDELCDALDISRATFYRFNQNKDVVKTIKIRPCNERKISEMERSLVLDLLNCDENIDKSPKQIFYELLSKNIYICSLSSFYRILKDCEASVERRKLRRSSFFSRPELIATAPNQVWSWDVSKLLCTEKLKYYYLYVIIDIYSRYVVGWTVAESELSEIALDLFQQTFKKQHINEQKLLVVHSDNGPIMKSDLLLETYDKLNITRSLNRPYVSNDNPFLEANFKTLKYSPGYPIHFQSMEEADAFLNTFYKWYNEEHFHSGIKCLTPMDVHYGTQIQTIENRKIVMNEAKKKNPNRFLGNKSTPCIFNEPVYINKPINNVS